MATGGRYPWPGRGRAISGDAYVKHFDSKTAVWYKIPIFQNSYVTRIRLDPEICQLLEEASQQRRKEVSFTDKITGSFFTAYLETKQLYMRGSTAMQAYLERDCEEREEDRQRNTAVGRGISLQTSNENRKPIDTMKRQMTQQYRDKASQLVTWLKDVTNRIMQKEFPANLKDMKLELAEIGKIRREDIPNWTARRNEIKKIYEDLQDDGAKKMITDESLDPASIKDLSIKFGSEMEKREAKLKGKIAKLESLESQLKKFEEDTEHLDGRLDNIEHHIGDVKQHQDEACSLQDRQESVAPERELQDIEDRVKSLMRNLETMQKGGHSDTDHMLRRLQEQQSKAAKIRNLLFSSTSQKPSQLPLSVILTKQHQKQSNGAYMVKTNPVFQGVQDCLHWIDTKQAALEGASYGSAIDLIIQELDQHDQEHQFIWDYRKVVDRCINERDKLDQEEKEIFNELHTKVQEAYGKLLDTSSQRHGWLQSLLDFVQKAVQVLDWLQQKIEVIYNCSPELDLPFGQVYQGVIKEMKDMETNFILVQDIGRSLVHQIHPAKITIETYISDMESRWSWLLQLLECLKVHIMLIYDFKTYFQEVSECAQWMTQQTENVNNWMRHHNVPIQELEQRKTHCQKVQENLVKHEQLVASLGDRCCRIIPLFKRSEQSTSQIKASSLCCYEQDNMSLQKDEECFLLDNRERVRWRVKNARGQEDTVPSVCLIIPPPNTEAIDHADRLKVQLKHLQSSCNTCQRKLAVLSTIEFIKSGDLAQDPSKCEMLLRDLKVEAAWLIEEVGETDLKMQQQLQKELEECNTKVQEFSKKCFEEGFPYQWEKFEMRFDIEKENKCFSSTLYTIMDVSPGQMQYIAGNEDERDSLLGQLGNRHFRGVFELGLLRIYLQNDEDIRKMVDNPKYGIHLEKEVIKVLNAHIHRDPVIKEEKLSQFGLEDVQQAQELGHLKCIKSRRVKIYIHKSGKGVSIVGREVGKYIQFICRALEQGSRNEPESGKTPYQTEDVASSVSETKISNRKFDTDRDFLSETSLNHAEETKELKKYGKVNEHVKKVSCTIHVTQMLTDSDYAGTLSITIPEVAVNYISNEVVFQGPPEAVMEAEGHLKQYLMSKGFWHEVDLAESLMEASKTLKFEEDLQRKIPDVYIKFAERKVIFIGEEKLLQTSEDELCKFKRSIKRAFNTYDSITMNYLKLKDVQRSIWEQFENRQIKCYWHVIEGGINLFCKSEEELKAAMSALEECIVISHLSIRSDSDLQEFENSPDVKKLINQNQGRLHRELILGVGCVVYVGTHEVIAQIEKLHGTYRVDQKYEPQEHSFQVLLSQPLLAYVRKYLIENMKQKFQVNIQNLDDLSGINISGAEDSVQNAVSEVEKQIRQMSVDIYPLRSPEITNTIDRQGKEIVATVEEETKTVIEIVSLPRRGKDTMRVSVFDKLDVCLVYGSTPGREVDIQLIPVNNSFFPVCLAAVDIMEKGVSIQTKAAEALNRYLAQYAEKKEMKKPEAFQFIYDDSGSNHHIVYFVMPDDPNDIEEFKEKFKCGLSAVLNYASQRKKTSLSLPLEMHEKLSVKQMVMIILETLKSFLAEIPQHTSINEIILCSVEKCNQSLLRKCLDAVTPGEQSVGEYVIEDFFDCEEGVDSHVDIAIVTGSLLDQQVEVIVNSTTRNLDLADGYLTRMILDAAGSTIQDECRKNYPDGIEIGEIAVTSAGMLKFRKIFHGALCLPDMSDSHLLSLRRLMKNCLEKAKEERCHSIAFPALGIGRLKYPADVVAKEMFRAVTTYAKRCGVKSVKFVLPEKLAVPLKAFKEMEDTRNSLLQSSTDCKPEYEVNLEGSRLQIAIVALKKYTMSCDVDVVLGNPTDDTPTERYILNDDGSQDKVIAVKRDPKSWSERLYLCLKSLDSLKEKLTHAVQYAQHMKFTSLSVFISQITKADMPRSAIEDVIVALDTCKSDVGDLESVMIVINDAMLQSLTPWFDENVKASQGSKTIMSKLSTYLGFKVPMIWKKFHNPCTQTSRTYLRVAGDASLMSSKIYDTIQERLKELDTNGEQARTRSSDSQSSNTSTGSFDIVKVPNQETESTIRQKYQDESPNAWRNKVEGTSALTPEKTDGTGSCPSKTDLSEVDQEDIMAFMECKMEVGEDVLNSIKITHGQQGIDSLISDLDQYAKVDMYEGRVLVLCDYRHAENVQRCVKSHYDKVRKERKTADQNKHLINGGNDNLKEWLRFAYAHTSWIKNLQLEGGKLYLTGTLQMKKEVEKAVHSMNYWYREEFVFTSEEQQKAVEVSALVKNELPAVFIKQTEETMIVLSDNRDNFERANYKVKVALGRIKITARGRGSRDPQLYSSMSKEDKMDANPKRPSSGFQSNQPTADLALKSYCTKEGLMAKVYLGNITSLPVDCIVNAANRFLSHGGGVALAISKAAGEDFDQEGEEYVKKNGPVQVTQCCVTSAGRLPYKFVIHAVGPQWSDYKDNEKDRCIDDLKKTIVSCMIKANKFKMASIAIPPLSSGIFGVPKDLCAQMYAKGVVEYSKNYGLQFVKEIHFVDTVSEMCQLTQSAFDKELM